jgi:hypothetical protein
MAAVLIDTLSVGTYRVPGAILTVIGPLALVMIAARAVLNALRR